MNSLNVFCLIAIIILSSLLQIEAIPPIIQFGRGPPHRGCPPCEFNCQRCNTITGTCIGAELNDCDGLRF
eukprot:Pgem_evm1s17433